MKRSFTHCVCALACFLASVTTARSQDTDPKTTEEFYSDFYVIEAKPMQFKMTYHFPVHDRVTVKITDGHKNLLYSEKVLVWKKYEKFFDLTGFHDGRYTFELQDGDKLFVRHFLVETKVVRMAFTKSKEPEQVLGF